MKITHFLPDLSPEQAGLRQAVVSLCNAMARAGSEVVMIAAGNRRSADLHRAVEQVFVKRKATRLRFSRDERKKLQTTLATTDVVHLHGIWPLSTWPAVVQLATQHQLPMVLTPHGMLSDWAMSNNTLVKNTYLCLYGYGLLRKVAVVHATADLEVSRSASHLNNLGKRIRVLPLPVDLARFDGPYQPDRSTAAVGGDSQPTDDATNVQFVILYLGRLVPKKRPDLVIQAVGRLANEGVPFELIIAGAGTKAYTNFLIGLAESLGVAGCTRFLGFVSEETKRRLYDIADVFLLPTSMENFGYTIVEALASGTPVVTTRHADIWPDLERSGGALLAEQRDDSFADAIMALVQDRRRAADMGSRGRRWVFDYFQEASLVTGYEEMYRHAMSSIKAGSE